MEFAEIFIRIAWGYGWEYNLKFLSGDIPFNVFSTLEAIENKLYNG